MEEIKEIWINVIGYEHYKVSNLGRIISTRYDNGRIMKGSKDRDGYLIVTLRKNNIQKTKQIHQLVAIAFLNHSPNSYEKVIDHINGIVSDNRLENLRVVSHRFNISNGYRKDRNKLSSRYAGVCWDKRSCKWQANIRINGRLKHLGYFIDERVASNAYIDAVKKYEDNKLVR